MDKGMIELNKIYCEDCLETMKRLENVDLVLTSPPYNTSRKSGSLLNHNRRYEEYGDYLSDEEYTDWTIGLFDSFDKILKQNGSILYNMSYSSENTSLIWNVISEIQRRTNFIVADCIVWKKKAALPNDVSPNKLTRICEFVFVFCRKSEFATFFMNKGVSSVRKTGQTMYNNVFNFIEAPNNDENCPIHKAAYSTLLCRKLLLLYSQEGGVIYDPFMGTGTTAIACHMEKRSYIGSEISERYCEWANERIRKETQQLELF